ncbi:MAG TPA: methyltransferase, TIGR04325 family [Edaphobacter sp.]
MSLTSPSVRQRIWKTPGVQEVIGSRLFSNVVRKPFGQYWGYFKTYEEALNFLPSDKRSSYDNSEITSLNVDFFYGIQFFDWPVLFFLELLLAEGKLHAVTDFGGHIGVKYLAYREIMPFPADIKWQVVELPAMIAEAKQRLPADVGGLEFMESPEQTAACDVLICSGVLQYSDLRIEKIVEKLPKKPQVVIINKLAAIESETFYTLENYGKYKLPYRVCNAKELDATREKLGYHLTQEWNVPREIVVISPQGKYQVQTIGQVWTH